MRKSFLCGAAALVALAGTVSAEVPSVATDIPPVHSLVAKVMEGVGTPDLIVQPGASPHGYSLRPSEAKALQNADIIFWVGAALTPWLEGPVESLAADATSVQLLETDGTIELEFREGVTFEAHDHNHDDHGHAEEGHDHEGPEHSSHDPEETHAHHDDHGHDPHAWLDPENARTWLGVIATELSTLDPENADSYGANAEAGQAELAALIAEIDGALEPQRGRNFVVFHDAYQYFENRFQIAAVGSITLADASAPSPARIAEIRDKVSELGVSCAFAEPQFNPNLVRTVFEGSDATTGVLDPLGVDLEPGPELYPRLISNLADTLVDCLK